MFRTILDPTTRFQYYVERSCGNSEDLLCFVTFHPSTGEVDRVDALMKRFLVFGSRLGFGLVGVVNLFAYRATGPKDLERSALRGDDVIGPENDAHIEAAIGRACTVVAAWGGQVAKRPWALDRVRALEPALAKARCLRSLGLTGTGFPKHPFLVSSDAQLVPWP